LLLLACFGQALLLLGSEFVGAVQTTGYSFTILLLGSEFVVGKAHVLSIDWIQTTGYSFTILFNSICSN